ncbi:MAG: hypothetical protein M1815_004515 [Lichina confinis]|nr:MAG: hypothetical protein M1815_004515 [Lichina confinis]
MASQQLSKSETVHNLTKVGEDEDKNMDDDAQEVDTTRMSTEKQPASTNTEGAPHGLSPGARQVLATQLKKNILAEEIEVAALKRSLHLQKVRAKCETLRWELELLGVMEVDTVTDIANAQATQGDTKQDVPRPTPYEGKNQRELDNFLLQCWNTFTMRLNTYESDEYWANKAGWNPFTWESFQKFLQNELKLANLW